MVAKRTPAQKAASVKNLEKARAARKARRATGKLKARNAGIRKVAMEKRFGKRNAAKFLKLMPAKRAESRSFGVRRGAFITDQLKKR